MFSFWKKRREIFINFIFKFMEKKILCEKCWDLSIENHLLPFFNDCLQ
jgi:hypothetical protein